MADDSEFILQMVTVQLEARGFEALAARSGADALMTISAERLDAVILDVEMPGMSGLEVARTLRSTSTTALLPTALHTSLPESDVRSSYTDYDAFLAKPCLPSGLEECLVRLMTLSAAKAAWVDKFAMRLGALGVKASPEDLVQVASRWFDRRETLDPRASAEKAFVETGLWRTVC